MSNAIIFRNSNPIAFSYEFDPLFVWRRLLEMVIMNFHLNIFRTQYACNNIPPQATIQENNCLFEVRRRYQVRI